MQAEAIEPIETIAVSTPNPPVVLKIFEYVSLAGFVSCGILTLLLPGQRTTLLIGAIALSVFLFFFLLDQQLSQTARTAAIQAEIKRKAELYFLSNSSGFSSSSLQAAREKAISYTQDLINDYKKTRNLARTFYYILQMTTIVFSGVTPILVLVDKLESGQPWLKWLPVICPAIASIVASIVTSFPFQKNWVAANTAVELLEAEQEKFILGITPAYRCFDCVDETEQLQRMKQAVENFVTQVNNIHLNLLQSQGDNQQSEQKTEQKMDSSGANSNTK